MADRQKIMIVDNNENIAEHISRYLTEECNFNTIIVTDGSSAVKMYSFYQPDLILLELSLPDIDGYQVCRRIREYSKIPIILLSDSTNVLDLVRGLELGADDYIERPFDSKELSARINAVLRRMDPEFIRSSKEMYSSQRDRKKVINLKDLSVDLDNYTVLCRGKVLEMPPKEIELLYFLSSQPNHVFTREQLLNHIWGYDYAGDTRTVDVHIMRLREKIGTGPNWSIGTVWGVGYRFNMKEER